MPISRTRLAVTWGLLKHLRTPTGDGPAMILPPAARPLLAAFASTFTRLTPSRFVSLRAAAILTHGRHTVANLVRTLGRRGVGRVRFLGQTAHR